MTLLIASKCKNAIVLGCDSRSIIEDPNRIGPRFINDNEEKLISLNNYCCIMVAGDSQAGTYLINKFRKTVNQSKDVVELTREFSEFCIKEYKPYISYAGSKNCPRVSFILAGLTKEKKKYINPKIFTVSSDTSFFIGEENHYTIVGIDEIANYLFAKLYNKYKISSEKMTDLIVQCLYDTEKIDGQAGGTMHLVSITEYGVSETNADPYIEKIKQKDLINIMEE